ncbi:right-handed parallel beta-helix repeat-containing protein [Stieleria sp. TO1_6]|uniref:right-handed parallel beta-helix repeat-containing protein n=1 Tax=Stieleria tagensis TaxID=2956795 RepID=UPI00209B19A8|nr:right-handed parallel beta-helix repeat-containing protein [Stieleria tagensis]MCO8123077.1 right-handed parallel beta-helix repeat-containing protein [Stieleria tagensis]
MKQLVTLILLIMTSGLCNAAGTDADFYVSPKGSDAWSGTSAEPFATLARARDAVRELKKSKSTDIVVLVRGGTYRLDETVVFGLEDSGGGESTITYAAYPGEKPIFSGAREITGFQKVTGDLPDLPKEAQGKVLVAKVSGSFRALYDAEGLLPRTRSVGFRTTAGGSLDEFNFPEGMLKHWSNVEDVEILIRAGHQWMMNILPLVSVDEQAKTAHTSIDATYGMNSQGESCWVENILEELNEPGEWALNTKEGKLYLWPRAESPVLAPQLTELIRVEGKIDEMGPTDIPVRSLCFRGLTFMHGDRYLFDQDDAGVQHDWDVVDKDNALVRLRGTENCVVEKCHFLHSGSGAVRVDLYGQENKISNNRIEHIGGTGIFLGGYGPGTKDVNKKNLVYNNHIHHVGELYWHSPGILLWQSGENRVANNLIHNTNYCGMIICGMVTRFITRDIREVSRSIRRHEVGQVPANPTIDDVRPFLHSHDNLIEYNEIHHVMQKLGDGNGIYIRGSGPGNIIRRNYIHHLVASTGAQSGIRTDGGQMDTLIAENLVYRCTSQGFILKLNTRAENNIIAYILDGARQGKGKDVSYVRLAEGPSTGGAIKHNIFYHHGSKATFFTPK